ncbi:hypothetical protein [Clostridium tagluense]|uniref:Uncharacterized protein n=1 Tax=Clostridium tagluense TaxID=360422 RepID=A0A401USZ2_9CLOT|nr:hypothetical protein [Clostridium tagluense]GCD12626.1 hypothetical protein Ctaglu_42490 [Clostridium tagluense]
MKIVMGWNQNENLRICGTPTNLYVLDGDKKIQLCTGDEVLVLTLGSQKLAIVVEYNGIVGTYTNKEVYFHYETENKNNKIVKKGITLVRSYKEYKDGDEVAKGRKCGGFIVKNNY